MIRGLGGIGGTVVLGIVLSEKFFGGAYLVAILIPVLVAVMLFIHRQYRASARQLAIDPAVVIPPPSRKERIVVPVAAVDRAVVQAINLARSIRDDIRAVVDPDHPGS